MSDQADDHTGLTLRRVAATLGVPVAAFFEHRKGAASWLSDASVTQAEVGALLDAFLSLADPRARRRCIESVEAEVRRIRETESDSPDRDGVEGA